MSSPFKITTNPRLPKNEKELICMLLAGRLKDLWNGRLFCIELSINDLIKDTAGIDALGSLKQGLQDLKGAVAGLRAASGYDNILNKVNQALGSIGTVFSLGGLCPSPITPPKIPDVLGQLNQNLFGQANSILNALAKASNPKMCFGGGPNGFGVNWNSMTGDLANLKRAIDAFKNDPAGLKRTITAFERNIQSQTRRLNAELDRLSKNLQDPFGINKKQNTARSIQRAASASDGLTVKDRNGIEYKNPIDSMITGDVDAVLNRTDPLSTQPIIYKTEPVLNYCGEVEGYKRVAVSGDLAWAGWDTDVSLYDEQQLTPTVNPPSAFANFDFTFFEEDDGKVSVYDRTGNIVDMALVRGVAYKIGFKLKTTTVQFYNGGSVWFNGLTYSPDPAFGIGSGAPGVDVIQPNDAYAPPYETGEAQWAVLIENPTTPNLLQWRTANSQTGNITVTGYTVVPLVDRSYDLDMAFRKGLLLLGRTTETENGFSVEYLRRRTVLRYDASFSLQLDDGSKYEGTTQTVKWGSGANEYYIYKNREDLDDAGNPIEGNKIYKLTLALTSGKYLLYKMYFNDNAALKIQQVSFGICDNLTTLSGFKSLFSIKYAEPITFVNDSKLPFKDGTSYRWSAPMGKDQTGSTDDNLYDTDELEFSLLNKNLLKLFLTSERDYGNVKENSWYCSHEVRINPTDPGRTYTTTDPFLYKTNILVRGLGETFVSLELIFKDALATNNKFSVSLTSSSFQVQKNEETSTVNITPVTASGGLQPYKFSITPEPPVGMIFDSTTSNITGTASSVQPPHMYTVVATDLTEEESFENSFSIEVTRPAPALTIAQVNAAIAAALASYSGASGGGGSGGGDGTVIGPGPGLPELPAELLDPNNGYFSTTDGYVWGPDPERGGISRWSFVPPPIETINAATGQVWRANWDRATNTWVYPPRPW